MQHCPALSHAEGLIHITTCAYIWDNYFSKCVLRPCPVFLSPGIDFWGLVSIISYSHWLGQWFSKCCPRPAHQQHLEACKEWNLLAPTTDLLNQKLEVWSPEFSQGLQVILIHTDDGEPMNKNRSVFSTLTTYLNHLGRFKKPHWPGCTTYQWKQTFGGGIQAWASEAPHIVLTFSRGWMSGPLHITVCSLLIPRDHAELFYFSGEVMLFTQDVLFPMHEHSCMYLWNLPKNLFLNIF